MLLLFSDIVPDGHLDALACKAFGQVGGLGHSWEASWAVDCEWFRESFGEHVASCRCWYLAGRTEREQLECKSKLAFLANTEIGKNEETGS